jgi:exodeoxyribonuclease V beta subunit
MRVFDVLNPALKMQGAIFLEAAAGCGKTFAIEHILVRLLLEENIQFEECLVVTFTKAAALDLKKRIFQTLSKIEKAILCNRVEELKIPYLEQFTNKQVVLQIIQKAIENMNQATISTIHGFCFQFLNEKAFFVGLQIDQQAEIALDEIVEDALRALPKEDFPAIWFNQIKKPLHSIEESIVKELTPYLGYPLAFEKKWTFDELYGEFLEVKENFLKANTKQDPFELIERIKHFNGICDRSGASKYEAEEKILLHVLYDQIPSKGLFEKFLSIFDFIEIIVKGKIAKKIEKDLKAKQKCLELIDQLIPFYEIASKSLERSNIALNLLEFLQQRLKEVLKKHPLSHPDYLLKEMAKVVETKENQALLQAKYKAILIDEFQDTDPLQWKIFETAFFHADNKKLFACVGDPKQSIYGFRNADLATYLYAKEQFPIENRYILDTNFRSEKKLIDGLNECFMIEQPYHFFHYEPSLYKIDYFPIKAKHEKLWNPQDNKLGLHYPIFYGDSIKEIEEEKVFLYLANETISLKSQGIELDEIAFLVKDRYQGQRLKNSLEKKGFTFSALKTDSVLEEQSFSLVFYIVEFLADSFSHSGFKKILYHPFVRKQEYFDEHFIEDEFLKLKSSFQDEVGEIVLFKNFPKILEAIFSFFKILESVIEGKNFQAYDDLILLKEFILDLSKNLHSYVALKQAFIELKNKSINELQKLKKRTSIEDKSPTIITMHSSKGLEYEVVFVLGLYNETKSEQLFYKDEEDPEKKWGPLDKCKSDLHVMNNDLEKMRQFYVAMTRAKYRVYFPIVIENEEDYSTKKDLSPMILFLKKGIHKTDHHKTLYSSPISKEEIRTFIQSQKHASFEEVGLQELRLLEKLEVKNFEKIYPPQVFQIVEKEMKMVSFTSLAEKKEEKKITAESLEAKGALFGTFFHELVEKLIESRLYDQTNSVKFHQWLEKKLFLTPFEEDFSFIFQSLHLLMTTPFIQSRFAICDFPYQSLMPEMKMELQLRTDLQMKGFLDLCVFYDGKLTIIDFKTNFLGNEKQDYSSKALSHCIQTNEYDLQAACYLEAAMRYLKITNPSLSAIEVEGVYFVFIRGLRLNEGIFKLEQSTVMQEIFDDAIISRT